MLRIRDKNFFQDESTVIYFYSSIETFWVVLCTHPIGVFLHILSRDALEIDWYQYYYHKIFLFHIKMNKMLTSFSVAIVWFIWISEHRGKKGNICFNSIVFSLHLSHSLHWNLSTWRDVRMIYSIDKVDSRRNGFLAWIFQKIFRAGYLRFIIKSLNITYLKIISGFLIYENSSFANQINVKNKNHLERSSARSLQSYTQFVLIVFLFFKTIFQCSIFFKYQNIK